MKEGKEKGRKRKRKEEKGGTMVERDRIKERNTNGIRNGKVN